MNIKMNKKAGLVIAAAVASALTAGSASASHFRGAALVPSVDANGVVTVDAKSFWRTGFVGAVGSISVSGGISATRTVINPTDFSDSRRAEVTEQFQFRLPSAGLYTMSFSSCCWVNGVANANGGSFGTTSTIYWDGSSANTPIQFDLENIQQQVIGGSAYSDNLDAVGVGLTYDDTHLSTGVTSQARGFDIDATGQVTMSAASTALYTDNTSGNEGADEAFSGKINAGDNSSVEFVWVFDTVDSTQATNLAPEITDVVINALVGDTIDQTLQVSDPDGDPVTTSFLSFLGTGGAVGNSTFDPNTLEFSWDSTGFGPGQYTATFGASDGSLTDQGTITINLSARPTGNVSEPSALIIAGAGLLGLASLRRRRNAKK